MPLAHRTCAVSQSDPAGRACSRKCSEAQADGLPGCLRTNRPGKTMEFPQGTTTTETTPVRRHGKHKAATLLQCILILLTLASPTWGAPPVTTDRVTNNRSEQAPQYVAQSSQRTHVYNRTTQCPTWRCNTVPEPGITQVSDKPRSPIPRVATRDSTQERPRRLSVTNISQKHSAVQLLANCCATNEHQTFCTHAPDQGPNRTLRSRNCYVPPVLQDIPHTSSLCQALKGCTPTPIAYAHQMPSTPRIATVLGCQSIPARPPPPVHKALARPVQQRQKGQWNLVPHTPWLLQLGPILLFSARNLRTQIALPISQHDVVPPHMRRSLPTRHGALPQPAKNHKSPSMQYMRRSWHILRLKRVSDYTGSTIGPAGPRPFATTQAPRPTAHGIWQLLSSCILHLAATTIVAATGSALYSETKKNPRVYYGHKRNDSKAGQDALLIWLIAIIQIADIALAHLTNKIAVGLQYRSRTKPGTGCINTLLTKLIWIYPLPIDLLDSTSHELTVTIAAYFWALPALKATGTLLGGLFGILLVLQLVNFSLSPNSACFATVAQALASSHCAQTITTWLSYTLKNLNGTHCPEQPAPRKKKAPRDRARDRWWARFQRRAIPLRAQRTVLQAWSQALDWLAMSQIECEAVVSCTLSMAALGTGCWMALSAVTATLPGLAPHFLHHPQVTIQWLIFAAQLLLYTCQTHRPMKSCDNSNRVPNPIGGWNPGPSPSPDSARSQAPPNTRHRFYWQKQEEQLCQIHALNALFGREVLPCARALQYAAAVDTAEPNQRWSNGQFHPPNASSLLFSSIESYAD